MAVMDGEPECINKTEIQQRSFPYSQNSYKFIQQAILCQVAAVCLLRTILHSILAPLGQTPTVSYLLAGFVIGPSCFGRSNFFMKNIVPSEGSSELTVFGNVGIMMYLFLLGLKVDITIIKRSSRKAWVTGIATFIIPFILTFPLSIIKSISYFKTMASTADDISNQIIGFNLPMVAIMMSTTSFQVVSCFLTDLKILNTELGRLATSISTISGMLSWITITISFTVMQSLEAEKLNKLHYCLLSGIAMVIFIAVFLRKYVLWIIKRTPRGENIKEIHLFSIFLMIFGTGFIGQCIGQRGWFGPMVLGLAIPNGEPVGSTMTKKLESLVSGLFLPTYLLNAGYQIFIFHYKSLPTAHYQVLLYATLAFVGKFSGTIIPCLFYQVPIKDSITLGLILCTLGIFDVTIYFEACYMGYVNGATYTWMVVFVLIIALITSPLVRLLYKPSKKYNVNKNRTIQNVKQNAEFRILVYIYNEDNVPPIVNILETSNPTRNNPISIYLLHIIELQGRSTPLLISHQPQGTQSDKSTPSDHIINCFRIYERQNRDVISLHPFTAITHLVSAHDDICTMALDNKTSLIIIPFHKQWNIDGIKESSKYRNVNQKVIDRAPCSVGLLIDRGTLNQAKVVRSCWSTYNIGVIFLGGGDDREALCYAMRMAEHPNIHLIVHRLVPISYVIDDINDKILDDNFINRYRLENASNDHNNMYAEKVVKDGFEIVSVIRAMENSYDLMLVGVHQDNYSSMFTGLTEWNTYPEIGFFGDMFASSDLKGSFPVLVMQQHSSRKR